MEKSKSILVLVVTQVIFFIDFSWCFGGGGVKDLCSNKYCDCVKDLTSSYLNVNCTYDFQQDVVISEKFLPLDTYSHVEFNNINELKILQNTFNKTHSPTLKQIKFTNIQQVHLQSQWFGKHSVIHFENVTISEIPQNTISSPLTELRITSSRIQIIRSNAFSALSIFSISIFNTTIGHVETGAFSDRTLIDNFKLDHVNVPVLDSNAILSGINTLIIQHSRISDIGPGGVNNTAGIINLSNNVINNIKTNGLILNQGNNITIENNTFKTLETNAISINPNPDLKVFSFNFIGNAVNDIARNCFNFNFDGSESNAKNITIYENYFIRPCNCDFHNYLSNIIINSYYLDIFYRTSYCKVDKFLSKCLNKQEGILNIENFTENACVNRIICESNVNNIEPTKTRLFPDLTNSFDLIFDDTENVSLIQYIISIVVILLVLLLIFVTCMYIKQKDLFQKIKSNFCMNIYSKLFSKNNDTKCKSKQKIFINEYSELDKHIKIDINDILLENNSHYDALYVNKATQTLPEELTQELLQNLREKLEDPNEYCLARDMIEHLYDLIKIEESCNRNMYSADIVNDNHYMSSAINNSEPKTDNIYDEIEIRPNRTTGTSSRYQTVMAPLENNHQKNVLSTFQTNRSNKSEHSNKTQNNFFKNNNKNKKFVNVGTRVPSPDKLLPYDFPNKKLITVLDDYQLPKDNKSSSIYSELSTSIQPDIPPLPREQLRLLDNAINIYIDTTLRRGQNGVYNIGRPLPHKPDESNYE